MVNDLNDELFEQLKGELEAIGVPEHLAGKRAARQLEGVAREAAGDPKESLPPHLVVPVSRGFMVIRRFGATGTELVDDLNAAIARACELATPVGAAVLVLGSDGRVERELG